jgi:hypothetical protein
MLTIHADDEQSPASEPKWVWRSQLGTTSHGVFSVLAAAEVLFAVAAYWGFAIWAHTQVHLLLGVLVTPLLLLRSEKSVQLGIRWFRYFDFTSEVPGSISWGDRLYYKTYSYYSVTRFAFLRVLVGLALMLIPLLFIMAGLISALFIRMVATVCYLWPGIKSLSDNWWRTLFATDFFSRPELIPGHSESTSFLHLDQLTLVSKRFIGLEYGIDSKNRRPTAIITTALMVLFFVLGLATLWFFALAPSYIYRMSIKSTAWIHWPLAYIARPLRYADDPEEIRIRLWADPREWLRRVFMIVTFAGALIATLPSLSRAQTIFPVGVVSIAEYAVLIDVKSLLVQPWRVMALISATITLILTWYGWELSLLVARSATRVDGRSRANKWAAFLEYAMRLRDVCGWLFWALVVIHAIIWLAPSTDWLTGYPLDIVRTIYGDYLPSAIRH